MPIQLTSNLYEKRKKYLNYPKPPYQNPRKYSISFGDNVFYIYSVQVLACNQIMIVPVMP